MKKKRFIDRDRRLDREYTLRIVYNPGDSGGWPLDVL